jgi:Tol biopolymer transport system component
MSTKALAAIATAALVCGIAAYSATASHATRAAFPGKNGRIVFNDRDGSLELVNPDGTGLVRLAGTNASDVSIGASWSPNGTRIAYSKLGNGGDADIFTIAPDASGQREITFSRGSDIDPTWSGDGSRIAFETNRNGNSDVYSVAADGSDPRQLTNSPLNELDPSWSAASGKIAFTVEAADKSTREIWVMNGDGSGKTQLTNAPNYSSDPNWSPDGRWIVFDSDRAEKGNFDVYKMRADGTGLVQLTSSPALDALPAFSPDDKKIVFVSDRAAKDSRKLFVMSSVGGTATRLIDLSGSTDQMVPDWQPLHAKDRCTIRGTINADHLIGTRGADVICGLGGDDTIQGLGGNDVLLGGAGDDWIDGGSGMDRLAGGSGDDVLQAHDGARDIVDGGPGRDAATVDKKLDKVTRVEELKRK